MNTLCAKCGKVNEDCNCGCYFCKTKDEQIFKLEEEVAELECEVCELLIPPASRIAYLNAHIDKLESQITEKDRVIEVLAEAYWNHDDYGFSEFAEIRKWAEAKVKELAQ